MQSSKQMAANVKVLQTIKAHSSDVTCLEFWSNQLFTGSGDKTVRAWRWQLGDGFVEEPFSPLLGHKYGVTSVHVSPQGSVLASASVDGTIILWDIADGTKADVLYQENGEAVRACAFSPDGRFIVSSDDSGTVCVWGQNKTIVRLIRCHEEAVHTVAFTPDSRVLLTACSLGNVRLHYLDIENDNLSTIRDAACSIDAAHDLGVLSADISKFIHVDPADSNTLIYTAATSGTDSLIKIWRIYCLRDVHEDRTDGSRLVPPGPQSHESDTATIYSTVTMNAECVQSIAGHGSSVTCVRFNATGTLLLSSSLDKSLKIWDLQGNAVRTLCEHSRYVNAVAVNSESSIVASGSNDRTVIVWDLTGRLTLDADIIDVKSALFALAARHQSTDVPLEFLCPITHELMRDPVRADDGFCYERSAILEWFDRGKHTSPMTNAMLASDDVEPNADLLAQIELYLKSLDFDAFAPMTPDLLT